MSLITVVGMLGGLAIYLLARRGQKAAERMFADQRAGLIGPREAARARVQQKERSLRLGKGVCAFLGLLLLAFLGRAAVAGEWDGMTAYRLGIVAVLLVVSAVTLRKANQNLKAAQAELDRPGR